MEVVNHPYASAYNPTEEGGTIEDILKGLQERVNHKDTSQSLSEVDGTSTSVQEEDERQGITWYCRKN